MSPPRCSQCSAPVASSCSEKGSAQGWEQWGTQTMSRDSDGHIPRDTELLASCSCRALPAAGTPLTRESSFPVAIAIADSRHPVVEKVQQLPQGPCVRNRGETGLQCSAGSPARAGGMGGMGGCCLFPPQSRGGPWAKKPTAVLSCSCCTAHRSRSSPGFSQVSRSSLSSSSQQSLDTAPSCAGSSPSWPSSSRSEAGGLRARVTQPRGAGPRVGAEPPAAQSPPWHGLPMNPPGALSTGTSF